MTPARRRSLAVGGLLGLAVALLAVVGLRAISDGGDPTAGDVDAELSDPGPTQVGGIPTQQDLRGATLPPDAYELLDGGSLRFADLAGRPMVVNFWADWCEPCKAEMPDFQAAHEELGERVAFVGVNVNDTPERATALVERTGVTYPSVRDPDGELTAAMRIVRMPTTLFVGPDGTVVAYHPGELSRAELDARISELFPRVIDGPFALAFTAGMLATVNPCGFAMLPAYLSFFLGLESAEESTTTSVGRALVVSVSVAAGFMAVFLPIGILLNAGVGSLSWARYASIGIGIALVVLGIAMLFGYRLPLTGPKLERGGRDRTAGSMVLFGVSYAVASLGCTIPTFIVYGVATFTRDGWAGGLGAIAAYGLGMALVLTSLTVALATARGGLLRMIRGALRYVDRVAAVLLIVAGAYLVYYWTLDVATDSGLRSQRGRGLARWANDRADDVARWLQGQDPVNVGLVLGAVVAVALAVVVARRGADR